MSYLTFVLQERRLLSFGVSFTFFSNFGQTFLISLFVPFFLESFTLSNAGFGSIYSGATLLSAMMLPWLGQWIDRMPLRLYSFSVAGGLLIASLVMMISMHVGILFFGIILLRLVGQGLSGHTAQATMARYYDNQRGKALSISSLGYPIGEAALPAIIAGLLVFMHWRTTWGVIALFIAVVLFPLIWFLIGRTSKGRVNPADSASDSGNTREDYAVIFSDPRIRYVIPSVLMPPFWFTGLFLYQISVSGELGWTPGLIATAFIAFAVFRVLGTLIAGPAIDRFSAQALFPFYLIPLTLGLAVPLVMSGNTSAFIYMALLGMTLGSSLSIKSALWAELFGPSKIGTAHSLFASMMVLSSALSPFLVGWLLDLHVPINYILLAGVVSCLISAGLSLRVHPRFQPKVPA